MQDIIDFHMQVAKDNDHLLLLISPDLVLVSSEHVQYPKTDYKLVKLLFETIKENRKPLKKRRVIIYQKNVNGHKRRLK